MRHLIVLVLLLMLSFSIVFSVDFSKFNCEFYSCNTTGNKTSCSFQNCDFIDFTITNFTIENRTTILNQTTNFTFSCNDTDIIQELRKNTLNESVLNKIEDLTRDNEKLKFWLNETAIEKTNCEVSLKEKEDNCVEKTFFEMNVSFYNNKVSELENKIKDVEQTRNIVGLVALVSIGYIVFGSEKVRGLRERFEIQQEAGKRALTEQEIKKIDEKIKGR